MPLTLWSLKIPSRGRHRTESVDIAGDQVIIKSVIAPPNRFFSLHAIYTYTPLGDGEIMLETTGEFHGKWPETVPRIGLQLTVPGDHTRASWFGRGPGET